MISDIILSITVLTEILLGLIISVIEKQINGEIPRGYFLLQLRSCNSSHLHFARIGVGLFCHFLFILLFVGVAGGIGHDKEVTEKLKIYIHHGLDKS